MAIPHAAAGEPICVEPAPGTPQATQTTTLIKTAAIEVIRLVLPAGKEMSRHQVPGEITLQCLSGHVTLDAGDGNCELSAGMLTYLSGGQVHSLAAQKDSTLLLTILLHSKAG